MPFTISHAAAALPWARYLRRRQLLSAAVIGTMVPDFWLLLPWHLQRSDTHSVPSLLSFNLPVGLGTYWIFQLLVKSAGLAVIPEAAYRRSLDCSGTADIGSARQWLAAGTAVLLGAVTHLLWDGFTHEGGLGRRMILMQDLNSLLGLLIVAWCTWRWFSGPPDQHAPPRPLIPAERAAWLLAYALTALTLAAFALHSIRETLPGRVGLVYIANDSAVATLRGLGGSLVAVSVLIRLRLRIRRSPA